MTADKVMTEEEFKATLLGCEQGYIQHRAEKFAGSPNNAEAIIKFKNNLAVCSANFLNDAKKGVIPATYADWICYYHGFMCGVQRGQITAAESMGQGDFLRDLHGV